MDYLARILDYASAIWSYAVWALVFLWVPMLAILFSKSTSNSSQFLKFDLHNRRVVWILRLLLMSATLLIIAARFIISPVPQGSDNPIYIYYLSVMDNQSNIQDILVRVRAKTYFVSLMLWIGWKISFLDIEFYFMVVPVILGFILVLSVYAFTKLLVGNELVSLVSSFLFTSSYTLIKVTYGLYAQTIGYALFLLSLGLYFQSDKGANSDDYLPARKTRISAHQMTMISLTVLALIHIETWAVSIAIIVLDNLLQYLRQTFGIISPLRKMYSFLLKVRVRRMILLVLPSIIAGSTILSAMYIFTPYVITNYAVPKYPNLDMSGMNDIMRYESTILLLFVLLFIPIIQGFMKERFPAFLVSFIVAVNLLITFSGFRLIWRLYILMPLSTLGAVAIYYLFIRNLQYNDDSSIDFPWRTNRQKMLNASKVLLLLFILLANFAVMSNNAYLENSVYRPSEDLIEELRWIRETEGFSNGEIAVYLNSQYSPDYRWAVGIVGDVVYVGEMFESTWYSFSKGDQIAMWVSAQYAGTIGNTSLISSASRIIVPESGILNRPENIVDYLALKSATYESNPGIYNIDAQYVRDISTNETFLMEEASRFSSSLNVSMWSQQVFQVPLGISWNSSTEQSQLLISGGIEEGRQSVLELEAQYDLPEFIVMRYSSNYPGIIRLELFQGNTSITIRLTPDVFAIHDSYLSITDSGCSILGVPLNGEIPIERIQLSIYSVSSSDTFHIDMDNILLVY